MLRRSPKARESRRGVWGAGRGCPGLLWDGAVRHSGDQ